jgi:hypothetical protein
VAEMFSKQLIHPNTCSLASSREKISKTKIFPFEKLINCAIVDAVIPAVSRRSFKKDF